MIDLTLCLNLELPKVMLLSLPVLFRFIKVNEDKHVYIIFKRSLVFFYLFRYLLFNKKSN